MKQKFFTLSSLPFFVGAFIFLGIKLSTLSIRLSDANIYFVTASHLLSGSLLYRDIFFTNFPFLPYFSTLYYLLFQGELLFFNYTAAIEAVAVAFLVFYLVLRKFQNFLLATLSGFVYLFSFLILATTDHQTGVFLASLFTILGYLFFEHHRYFLVGICCALMILVKAYFLPVLLTFACFLLLRREYNSLFIFISGGAAVTLIILLPFFIFAPEEFFSQVFAYSLTRGEGIPKFEIGKFFAFHDFLFLVVLIFNLIYIRVRLFFGLFSIFALAFFFVYQDIYYLYLNFAAPFISLSFPYFYTFVTKKMPLHTHTFATLLLTLFVINAIWSYSQFHTLGRVNDIEKIVADVRQLQPDYVYGNNDIAPAVSHLSFVPQLNGVIDTNVNMFRSGVLDREEITKAAVESKTVLILHGAYYPQFNVVNDSLSEIVDGETVARECQLIRRYPVHAEGATNALVFWYCG